MKRFAAFAGLAGVVESSRGSGLHGGVEVVGGQQQERVGTAELEDDLLEVAAGDLGDGGPRPLRAGEGDPRDPRVGDDGGDLVEAGVHVDVGPGGETGVDEDLLHRRSRLRALWGVLQDDGVADGEVRSGEPGDLVVGEVPRHDAEQRTVGAAADQR